MVRIRAQAVAVRGAPRATQDIDITVQVERTRLGVLIEALASEGFQPRARDDQIDLHARAMHQRHDRPPREQLVGHVRIAGPEPLRRQRLSATQDMLWIIRVWVGVGEEGTWEYLKGVKRFRANMTE